MNNSKKSQKKTVKLNEKQPVTKPIVATVPKKKQPTTKPSVPPKPKEKQPVTKPIVATVPKKKQPATKPSVPPKPNPLFPSTTGKPSGKGRGNNPPQKKMTKEAAERIRKAEERKGTTTSKDGFAKRAEKAAERNKNK